MRILFLDDQPEILDVFRKVCDPAILQPRAQAQELFSDESEPPLDEGFEPVLNLEFRGSFFQSANEAVEAFKAVRESPARFRIAVLDMQLPESSGLEVARELLDHDPNLNLVFVTAYSEWSIHDIAQSLARDQQQFMFQKKPFELQEVLQTLLFIHDKVQRELWQQESLRNLVNFTRGYKVESLQIFKSLLGLKSVALVKTLAKKKVPELIRKNEKVLELVEIIFTNDKSKIDETFSLGELFEEFEQQARVKVRFAKKVFQDVRVLGNSAYIAFALRCLVNNGLDFSSGEVTVSATLTENQKTEIMVQDAGPGIKGQFHNEIFDPGFKLDPGSDKAGFGLALVKKVLLTIHRADLAIRSVPGKGTAIKFSLPCQPPA